MYDPKTGHADVKYRTTWQKSRVQQGKQEHGSLLSTTKKQNDAVKTAPAQRVAKKVKRIVSPVRLNESEHQALLAAGWEYVPKVSVYNWPGYTRQLPVELGVLVSLIPKDEVVGLIGNDNYERCEHEIGHDLYCHGAIRLDRAWAIQQVLNAHPELLL